MLGLGGWFASADWEDRRRLLLPCGSGRSLGRPTPRSGTKGAGHGRSLFPKLALRRRRKDSDWRLLNPEAVGGARKHRRRGILLAPQLQNGRRRWETQARRGGAAGTAAEAVRAPRALWVIARVPRGSTSHLCGNHRGCCVPVDAGCSGDPAQGRCFPELCCGLDPRSCAFAFNANGSFVQPAKLTGHEYEPGAVRDAADSG